MWKKFLFDDKGNPLQPLYGSDDRSDAYIKTLKRGAHEPPGVWTILLNSEHALIRKSETSIQIFLHESLLK